MIGMSMEGRGSVKSESCQLIVCQLWRDTSRVRPRSARYRCATAYPIARMSMRGATGRGRAPLPLRLFAKKQ